MKARRSNSDRIYIQMKADVLNGLFMPGERLEAGELAMRFATSVTPVREALQRLVGEHLVESYAREGFSVPRLSETALRHLCDWNELLLRQALKRASEARVSSISPIPPVSSERSIVSEVERVFVTIGNLSGNVEHARAIAQANDRLRLVRLRMSELVPDVAHEIEGFVDALQRRDLPSLDNQITTYHRRRHELVPTVVGLLTHSVDVVL